VVSSRSKWTSISNQIRKEVLERDGNRCIVCGTNRFLTIAHVFVNRSHGGRGCKENLVCLCARHHEILDNPLGEKENELSKKIGEYCKNYLIKQESITFNNEFLKNLVFSKSPDTK
jgi:predicted restriction endonuclease